MNWFQNSKTKLSVILILAMMLTMVISTVASAEVWTDQEDYAPGSVVTLGGNNDENGAPGYVEGNSVDVVVSGPNDWTAACSGTVAADGAWSCTITLDSDPAIAVGDYSYTATSTDVNGNPISESGTFTDGPVASHTCIVTTDGGVQCWGYNDKGQLGDGTTISNTPVDVIGLTSDVIQVSTGANHTCALTTGGGVQCWGNNRFFIFAGVLGNGATISHSTIPVDVLVSPGGAALSDVTQVDAGEDHTCVVTTGGGVQCWGANRYGQIGDGKQGFRELRSTPVDVVVSPGGAALSGVAQVSAGTNHTCAVTTSGGVQCWGNNSDGQLGDGTTTQRATPVDVFGLANTVVQVSAGDSYTCAVMTDGGVQCWGNNSDGQLGNGTFNNSLTPVNVSGLISGITKVSAGTDHTCAVTTSGGLQCWGSNVWGQLGDGTNATRNTPMDVNGLTSGVSQVSVGSAHTCALLSSNGVQCWGYNAQGQLGDGTTYTERRNTPVDVLGLAGGVTQVSAGIFHTCALNTDGGVQCWGYNDRGQLGDGTQANYRIAPVDVIGLTSDVAQISVGTSHTCAVNTSGGVQCWGWNFQGQLGNGTIITSNTPVDVIGLTSGVAQVSAGGLHTCVVINSGVQCWGNNSAGQLGDGTSHNSRYAPVDVVGLTSGVAQVSAGNFHTCALMIDGGVKCWGNNTQGPLGDGTSNNYRFTPVDVIGLAGRVVQVSAGNVHTCAVLESGGVQCWGGTFQSNGAVDVVGLAGDVVQIDSGLSYPITCAVMEGSGGVQCWGINSSGQLGDGTYIDKRTTPVDVVGLTSGGTQVGLGYYHTCAATTDGGLKCWGDNSHGQLGDNSLFRTEAVYPLGLTSGACAVPENFCQFNQPPTAVAGGPYLVAVNASVAFDGSASSDPDLDMLTETWAAAGGTVVGSTYTAGAVPGIYEVCLTVNDGTVNSDSNCTIVVVYDPSGGFVTGGGWIDSPVNGDYQYMQVDGKASFGFVAKYQKGATVPDGNTEFQFKAGDLNFHSTSYEWLVVAGNTAQFKGEGTINGQGSYKFMLSADDDNPDTFRIKIWYEENGSEIVVYDNGSQQSLGGGSIVVHK